MIGYKHSSRAESDLFCIPFWVPIMLWIQRRLGLRPHDRPPDAVEVVIPLVVVAVAFEIVIPSCVDWLVPTVPDPNDVLAYCLGCLSAVVFWQWRYRDQKDPAGVCGG